MGSILRESGYDVVTELFDTEEEAIRYGNLAMCTWGRRITYEREQKWHLLDEITMFLDYVLK